MEQDLKADEELIGQGMDVEQHFMKSLSGRVEQIKILMAHGNKVWYLMINDIRFVLSGKMKQNVSRKLKGTTFRHHGKYGTKKHDSERGTLWRGDSARS